MSWPSYACARAAAERRADARTNGRADGFMQTALQVPVGDPDCAADERRTDELHAERAADDACADDIWPVGYAELRAVALGAGASPPNVLGKTRFPRAGILGRGSFPPLSVLRPCVEHCEPLGMLAWAWGMWKCAAY